MKTSWRTVAVAELKALQEDDLAWARPYVDEARASVARGEVITGEEFFRRLNDKMGSFRAK